MKNGKTEGKAGGSCSKCLAEGIEKISPTYGWSSSPRAVGIAIN